MSAAGDGSAVDGTAVLVAASHGTSDPAGQRAVAALVAAVAARASEITVSAAFVDVQNPDVPEVLDSHSTEPVVIVPLLLSAGYHVRVDLARVAKAATNPGVVVAGALGPDARLVQSPHGDRSVHDRWSP